MTFVALDFETADPKRDSACAIGLCRVEGGSIVYREAHLIRPPRGMSPLNQGVHGLSYDDVQGAPPFAEVWPQVAPVLAGAQFLVAHNASFDRSVLRACCCVAKIEAPALPWECTLELARAKWPKPASHKLPDVCRYLGIEFTNHHEAGADAEACARVLIALKGLAHADGGAEKPHPQTATPKRFVTDDGGRPASEPPEPVWEPAGECGAILDDIPAEVRSPAVVRLMRDAEGLGPDHCRDLVRCLGRWFHRPEPGRPRCRVCGDRCGLLCDLCTACIAGLP